jgi:uncharacterized protein YprB with RNaseH-like and TPR domain
MSNVLATYNGKTVDMGYITPEAGDTPTKQQLKEQFKYACLRIVDNSRDIGTVTMPDGKRYAVSRNSRKATLLKE